MKVYYITDDKEERVSPLFSSDEEALIWAKLNKKPIEESKYRIILEIIE